MMKKLMIRKIKAMHQYGIDYLNHLFIILEIPLMVTLPKFKNKTLVIRKYQELVLEIFMLKTYKQNKLVIQKEMKL